MLSRSIFSFLMCFLCAGLWIAPQQAHAQNKYSGLTEKVNYTAQQTNVAAVLESLQKQTDYIFTFDRPALSGGVLQEVRWQQATLGTALQFLEEQAGLSFLISNKNIAVTQNSPFKKKATGAPVRPNITLRGRVVGFET